MPLTHPDGLTALHAEAWKNINIKVRLNDLPALNQRLGLYGYETLGQLVKDFVVSKFPQLTEDRQIQHMDGNLQGNGLRTLVSGKFENTFYKGADLDDMLHYFLTIRRMQSKTAKGLVSYFRRYRDIFFGPSPPIELLSLKPHKRSWILQSMKHFGNYYFYKTNNPECRELVQKIIDRYSLNVGLDHHQRIYIVDDNYVDEKVRLLMAIPGDIGLTVKVGLFSGLREEEIVYIHDQEVCNNMGGCDCHKLHIHHKSNGMTIVVVNWFRGHKKCYFTILPTRLWEQFRFIACFNAVDIRIAHQVTKKTANVMFVELRKIHYNVMCRAMEMNEADILAGRAKSVSARHYVLYELDKMLESYCKAWEKFGVVVSFA
jgi:intergrase/recombinase